MHAQQLTNALLKNLIPGFLLCFSFLSYSQNEVVTDDTKLKVFQRSIGPNGFDEIMISQIRRDGGSDERVLEYIDYKKKQWSLLNSGVNPAAAKTILPKPFACGNVDVETGNFSGWTGRTGSTNGTPSPSWTTTGIGAGQHSIAPPPAADPCADVPGFPITLPAPNGGNHSIQLGNNISGCGAEQLSFTFVPTINDTMFTYQYAVVFEDPGHAPTDQPFFEFYMLNINGDTVPCSHQRYVAGVSVPGFQNSTTCPSVKYKPWSLVGINLTAFVGQPVTLFAVTADCNQCGHFGYAYIDFSCGTIPLSDCSGNQSTLCGPVDPGIAYTYQWYQNGNFISTQQCIPIVPNSSDTFLVKVNQPSGCNFYMSYVAAAGGLQSLFTYTANTNTVTFTDLSTAVTQWNWDFGDGNTSTAQNPSHTYISMGTYNACLIATDGACPDTVCKTITIAAVGVQEYDLASSLSIFPSPASKQVFLDFNGNNFGEAEISISNVIGEKMHETNILASGKQVLDVSRFSEGIYFVKIKTTSGVVTKKIVVSR